jgi:hypothetical protein
MLGAIIKAPSTEDVFYFIWQSKATKLVFFKESNLIIFNLFYSILLSDLLLSFPRAYLALSLEKIIIQSFPL